MNAAQVLMHDRGGVAQAGALVGVTLRGWRRANGPVCAGRRAIVPAVSDRCSAACGTGAGNEVVA